MRHRNNTAVGDDKNDPHIVSLIKRQGAFFPEPATRLRNNLLHVVGVLELANAGDFAANVWNDVPVPVYAIVFMALGGTLALAVSVFAFRDARMSWDNICFLRQERRLLKDERAQCEKEAQTTQHLNVMIDANFRDLGNETANRFLMCAFSGCGAVLIAVGTYMAIGGTNHDVWLGSNYLSGYIGNAPLAGHGVVNCVWAAFLLHRMRQHEALVAGRADLRDSPASASFRQRIRNLRIYVYTSSVGGVVGGAAAMVTATMWWGYGILIPVILGSMFYNSWLRLRVAYDRPPFRVSDLRLATVSSIVRDLESAATICLDIKEQMKLARSPLDKLVADSNSLASVVEFFVSMDLLEHWCLYLTNDPVLSAALVKTSGDKNKVVMVGAADLLALPQELRPSMIEMARKVIEEIGYKHFQYRQWYLSEVLGSCLRLYPSEQPSSQETKEHDASGSEHTAVDGMILNNLQ